MTPAAEAIDKLISYNIVHWTVTDGEETAILGIIRTDITPDVTVRDLVGASRFIPLLHRVSNHRRQLIELLGGRLTPASAQTIRAPIASFTGGNNFFAFLISNELQTHLAKLGISPTTFHNPVVKITITDHQNRRPFNRRPFTGSGATGTNSTTLSIPFTDKVKLLVKHKKTTRFYKNPIPGGLGAYLARLTPAQRRGQALILLGQPVVSFVPASYAGDIPDRSQIIAAAARRYNLDGATVAAFILAEQRDQSRNEDAADFNAAVDVFHDSSIGLGQVLISTVRRYDLFSDLLSDSVRKNLGHTQIAFLLTSDEFNIFAVAKYIRWVANDGARRNISTLPQTLAKFPGLNLAAYAHNSAAWPDDNIRALGSEYTSTAWDDEFSPGWGDFVFEARRDILAAGVF
jgi:hypothetical protein